VKKGTIMNSLKSRQFRFGGYATLIILVVLAVLVAVNILVGQIPGKLDLTKNKLYSLSDETYKLLDNLKADVTITTIGKVGSEDGTVSAILAKYASRSRHIKLQTKDPELNPGWTKQYDVTGQGLAAGTLVVAVGTKYKNIGMYDMYNYDTSNYDPSNPNSQPQLTSLSVEQRVTSAVQYVTAARNTTLYVLSGHGEQTLDTFSLTSEASNENYAVKDLNLLNTPAVPEDADVLLILAPKSDLPGPDADKVRAYLANGGHAVVLLDLLRKANELSNLADLLKSYGVEVRNVVVMEPDPNKRALQNPFYVLPNLEYHDILSPLRTNNYSVLLPGAQVIQTLDLKKKGLKVEALLTSSAASLGRIDVANNPSGTRLASDLRGPFNLAVAITDPSNDTAKPDTKLVVVGNVSFLAPSLSAQVPGNTDFFMNSIAWLKGQKDSITIRPKSLQTLRLTITDLQARIFSGLVVILLPLLILGAGLVVWMRRRHL